MQEKGCPGLCCEVGNMHMHWERGRENEMNNVEGPGTVPCSRSTYRVLNAARA